ncbi:MAG TPA: hypothetical protein VL172_05645 [Kofleriaceae bacterium]|jgi:hypothetical protein|nr:hypothetical protein [Kofleriaceae bacterium]
MSGHSHDKAPSNDTDLMTPDFGDGKTEDVSKSAHRIAQHAYSAGHGKVAGVAQQLIGYREPMLSEITFHLMRDHGDRFAEAVRRKVHKLQRAIQDADPDGLMDPSLEDGPSKPSAGGDEGPDGLMKPSF